MMELKDGHEFVPISASVIGSGMVHTVQVLRIGSGVRNLRSGWYCVVPKSRKGKDLQRGMRVLGEVTAEY